MEGTWVLLLGALLLLPLGAVTYYLIIGVLYTTLKGEAEG